MGFGRWLGSRKTKRLRRSFFDQSWRAVEHDDHGLQGQNDFAACEGGWSSTYQHFNRVLEAIGTEAESDTIDEVYRNLEPVNFSKGILEKIAVIYPEAIAALPVLQVFWSDWGSPQRIMDVKQKLGLTRSSAVPSRRTSGSVPRWQRQLV